MNTARRRRSLLVGLSALAMAASGVIVADAATPPPAHLANKVGLQQVGPIDETNGFPLWYKDTNGTRLELCTDPGNQLCIMGDVPNAQAPVSFPDNFPDEAFWSSAESSLDAGGGEKALLVTATEAAFGSADGLPAKGQQVSFGRIRVRAAGLVDNADYTVTHPYGVEHVTAEAGAVKGINTTEDIGSLTPDGVFDQTLGARSAPFLKWTGTDAPPGYLGDPTVDHTVTGSPYGTNFFRIEGPVGSFTGSTQLCADASLGNSPTATDDCIQSNDFAVQGKVATRGGVQVTKAYYANSGTGHMMDLFAFSTPGQALIVSGTGVSQTKMREDGTGSGRYFARVYADGAPPSDLAVTNTSDKPNSVDHVDQSMFGDKVHILSSSYNNDDHTLNISAQSGDDSATLKLDGYAAATPTVNANNVSTWKIPNIAVPPADALVTSNKGGVDSEDVVITGADDPSAQVVATITADSNELQVGQTMSLDALASVGTISAFDWTMSGAGATLTGTGASRTFTAQNAGTYVVTLKVTGNGTGNTDTDTITITVSGANAAPVADAGLDQLGVVPTSTVTLDGSASKFASTYAWTRSGGTGPAVTINNASTANPTFVVPSSTTTQTYQFTLTITDVNGTAVTDSVLVRSDPGTVTVDDAQYKRGSLEWRVRGSAQYCTANNLVSVYWNKPGASPVLLGTASPAADLGVCTYDFRLKNTPTALRPTAAGTVTVRSALGGEVLNRAFNLL